MRRIARLFATISLAALTLAGLGRRASAQTCDRGLALRMSGPGLQMLAQAAREAMPSSFSLPPISKVVYDWPMTSNDLRIELPSVPGAVSLQDLRVDLISGLIRFDGRLRVAINSPLKVVNAYVGLGDAMCQLAVQLSDVHFVIDLEPMMAGSEIGLDTRRATVEVAKEGSAVSITGCDVLTAMAQLTGALQTESVDQVQGWLEQYARQQLGAALEQALRDSLRLAGVYSGFAYSAQLSSVEADASGLLLAVSTSIQSQVNGAGACGLPSTAVPPPPPSCAAPVRPPSADGKSMYGVTVSEGLANQAIYALWTSGILCVTSDTLQQLGVEVASSEQVASMLGLPPGSRVSFRAQPQLPPELHFGAATGATLQLNQLVLSMDVALPSGSSGTVGVRADLGAAVTPWVDPSLGGLGVQLDDITVSTFELLGTGGIATDAQLDPARLQRFVTAMVVPLLQRQLASAPLAPMVIRSADYPLELQTVVVGDRYAALQLNLYRMPDQPDTAPPTTALLEEPPAVLGPQMLTLRVGGADNYTPPTLLRFSTRIDGGPWSDPVYGGRVDLPVHTGEHMVEIAAVDLAGNRDVSPVALSVTVDDTAPVLKITSRPEPIIDTRSAIISFSGSDNRTPDNELAYSVDLYRILTDGRPPELVTTEEAASGNSYIILKGLESSVYRARVIVADQAGNVSSEDVSFVVNTGGCAVVEGSGRDWSTALLVLLIFGLRSVLLLRRRRALLARAGG